jgi:glycosyltransferase involved in cell wall biosynthesis
MPKVSIIVPVYNAEEGLRRCVDSILTQEFEDFELLLMDDGSSDGSPALCDEFAARDPRVKVVHKENSGVSDTRNQALDLARGEFIQFVDADDWITSDATKLLVRSAERTGCDMVISDFYRVVGDRVSRKGCIEVNAPITPVQYADFMIENPANYYYGVIWNKLIRREIVERHALRMDPELTWCEDFIFNMEYITHCERIYPLRVPIYYYVKTEGSLVAKGMKPSSIVRMKLGMIDYYRDFFRKVYDQEDYRSRRGDIYGFMLRWAEDDGALALSPSTKRLGDERPTVREDAPLGLSPSTVLYLGNKLMEHYLVSIADRFDLEIEDVRVFVAVWLTEGTPTLRGIADLAGMKQVAVVASLQKLVRKRYLGFDTETLMENARDLVSSGDDGSAEQPLHGLRLGSKSERIVASVERVADDFEAVCARGLSEEECAQARTILGKVVGNVRELLS